MRASESAHLAETFLGMLREELGHLGAAGQTFLASGESVFPQRVCPVMSIAPLLSETTDDELWLMRARFDFHTAQCFYCLASFAVAFASQHTHLNLNEAPSPHVVFTVGVGQHSA